MRILRIIAITLAVFLAAACSGGPSDSEKQIDEPDENINATGMPIVKEKVTIGFMTAKKGINVDDWNTVANMKKMEEMSNVHIDWGLIPDDGAEEKRNLALASGEYPEVIYRTSLSNLDVAKYGEQGVFIPLNDLIEGYMPNLKALLEENPDIKAGLTFPDGNIYGMPTIYDPEFASLQMQFKLWVRQDWLDKFGMEVPTTLDEYTAYLEAVKSEDPNGNGKADEIPLGDGEEGGRIVEGLRSSFGIGNRGTSSGAIDADPNDPSKVRFIPTSDGYREQMTYLNELYSKGLIQKDIFSSDTEKWTSLGTEGLYGSTDTQAPAARFGKAGENYVALEPLKKAEGDEVPEWNAAGAALRQMGQFVITDKAEHPIEAARWMDYFYSDEGARLYLMGIEGESYEKTGDGEYEFTEKIANNPEGLTVDEALKPYVIYLGGSYPGIVKSAYFKGTENSEQANEGTEVVAPHVIDEIWPAFTYSSEESQELDTISADVDKFVEESRTGFITGKKPLSEWDSYVDQLNKMGLDRYMAIQQAAYDRYEKQQ